MASKMINMGKREAQSNEWDRILTELFPDEGEREQIRALTRPNGEPFFTLADKAWLIEALGVMDQLGFVGMLSFLKTLESPEQIVERSPLLDDVRSQVAFEERLDEEERKQNVVEGIYTCGRCQSKKVEYYEKQTRGADEAMTAFFNCVNCGKKWQSR